MENKIRKKPVRESTKAQVSLEYLLIMGVIFVIMIPIFYYALTESTEQIRRNQAEETVSILAKTADSIYALGPGSKDIVEISIPTGTSGSYINDTIVSIMLDSRSGPVEISAFSQAKLIGSLPLTSGSYKIPVEVLESGFVRIGSANDTSPPVVIFTFPRELITYNDITIKANTDEPSTCKFDENDIVYNSMSSFFIGSINSHQKYLGELPDGNYIYYVRCADPAGNIMQESAIINFTIDTITTINFSDDMDPPIIYLMDPEDNAVRFFWLVLFRYNVTDITSGIDHCTLNINGTIDGGEFTSWNVLDMIVAEDTPEDINMPLFRGNYTWQVSCVDNSSNANTGYSEIRNLRVNVGQGEEAFLNSCAGWCGWKGLFDGKCENNVPKCLSGCGLPYNAVYDCYAGDNASATYCTGGAESDTCCCVP